MGLAELAPGTRLYLDTNVWIYAIEGYPSYAPALKALLQRIDQKTLLAVSSDITLAEVLVKPMADARVDLQETHETALQSGGNLNMAPVTRSILREAARLRARYAALKLPDAIHAATAISAQCNYFVSNDQRFEVVRDLAVLPFTQL